MANFPPDGEWDALWQLVIERKMLQVLLALAGAVLVAWPLVTVWARLYRWAEESLRAGLVKVLPVQFVLDRVVLLGFLLAAMVGLFLWVAPGWPQLLMFFIMLAVGMRVWLWNGVIVVHIHLHEKEERDQMP